MNDHVQLGVSVITAIIGLAIVAVILSTKSATSGVIQAAGGALGGLLQVAVSPITGGGASGTVTPTSFGNFTSNAATFPQTVSGINSLLNSTSSLIGTLGGNSAIINN